MEEICIETESSYSSLQSNEIDYDNLQKYKSEGYIYICISDGWVYPEFTFTKVGSTKCIERRKWDYFTTTPFPVKYYAYFELVYIPNKIRKLLTDQGKSLEYLLQLVEKKIHNTSKFSAKRANLGGGTEFFHYTNYEDTLVDICDILSLWNIHYKLHRGDLFTKRPKKITLIQEKDAVIKLIENNLSSEESKNFQLREYQEKCYELSLENDKGIFVLPPALGKTFIAIKICLDYELSCILVPNIILVNQTLERLKHFDTSSTEIFCISSDDQDSIEDAKEELEKLYEKVSDEGKRLLIISTYQSSEVLVDYPFDVCCFDEAHRTCVENEEGDFRNMLENGSFKKGFFFTATPKSIKFNTEHKELDFSMENEEMYGKVLYEMKLVDCIEKGYISDYNIHIFFYPNEDVKIACLTNYIKSRYGKRIFVYSSRNKTSKELLKEMNKREIVDINGDKIDVKYFQLDGECSKKVRDKTLKEFKNYQGISVMFVCQLFGEGFDEKSIDTAFFYDICDSEISLIQKIGRSLRKDENKIKAKVVLCINREDDGIKRKYKRLLKKLIGYDNRWTYINKSRRLEENDWIGNVNNVVLDDEGKKIGNKDIDEKIREEVYDSFVEKLVEIPIEIKFKTIEKYMVKERKVPSEKIIYNDTEYGELKIGATFHTFINRTYLYKNIREKWLKIYEKYPCFIKYLEDNKNRKENRTDIPIEIKLKFIEEFIKKYKKVPKKNDIYTHTEYGDIKLSSVFNNFVYRDNSYKDIREYWTKRFSQYECFREFSETKKNK